MNFASLRPRSLAPSFVLAALVFGVVAVPHGARADDDLSIQPFSVEWPNAPYPDAVYESAEHADGIFVLTAFQNGCAPCNANEPNVDALAAQYAGDPRVQVLDLGLDADMSALAAWIARHAPNHPVVKDEDPYIALELSIDRIPSVAVVNCMGHVRYQGVGIWNDQAKADIRSAVDALRGETCLHRAAAK
jgi:hypothetical protein